MNFPFAYRGETPTGLPAWVEKEIEEELMLEEELLPASSKKEGTGSRSGYHCYWRFHSTRCFPASLVILCQAKTGFDYFHR